LSYRSDLEAGRNREAALEEKLAEREREVARLRAEAARSAPSSSSSSDSSGKTDSTDSSASEPTPTRYVRSGWESFTDLLSTLGWGFVVVGLPALGIIGPCVMEGCQRLDRSEREAAAARDEALFTRKATITWNASVERSEGIYFAPGTTCRISLAARSDGARMRGELTTTCGATTLYKETVDHISCQLDESTADLVQLTLRHRGRCLPPETGVDGARLMDMDTRVERAEVRDAERKGYVLLKVDEQSEARRGPRLFTR